MAYNMTKSMIAHLKEDAEYFPFEQIRSYKLLQKHPLEDGFKKEYFAFFCDVKKECEHLLKTEPNHQNKSLWKEAIEEINKII